MSFFGNLFSSKIGFFTNLANIIFWFIQVICLGSLGTSRTKRIVLYVFAGLFSLFASITMIILAGLDKLTSEARKILNYFFILLIGLSLCGASIVHNLFCFSYSDAGESCLKSARTYTLAAAFSALAMVILIGINHHHQVYDEPMSFTDRSSYEKPEENEVYQHPPQSHEQIGNDNANLHDNDNDNDNDDNDDDNDDTSETNTD
ncbi:32 kda heat shock protein-related [Anaeramoeba ignava]|uniref:32 kDa heat shock protein-related n=1 Tax=Anaeramoeba ignava TaxID=1746090 RepID=A0A9Q0LUH1_ANAIG|nr:32 kda heat shock protein-related [Anaeramoeba ignava]